MSRCVVVVSPKTGGGWRPEDDVIIGPFGSAELAEKKRRVIERGAHGVLRVRVAPMERRSVSVRHVFMLFGSAVVTAIAAERERRQAAGERLRRR